MSSIEEGKEKRRATFAKKKIAKEKALVNSVRKKREQLNSAEVEIVERYNYLPVLLGKGLLDWCEKEGVLVFDILEDGESEYMLIFDKRVYTNVDKLAELEKKMR